MKKSLIKIFISLFLIAFATNISRIPGTNSFFTDNAKVKGNSVTAGYWVLPTVTVSVPKDGDKLKAHSLSAIKWIATSSDPGATDGMDIDIDYKCDGIKLTNIVKKNGNTGLLYWNVPDKTYNNCTVRVTATDSHGLTNSGESGKFKIVSPCNAGDVVINEVMWMGTWKDHNDQWIELRNTTDHDIDITDWNIFGATKGQGQLGIAGDKDKYTIPANGYFLVTRLDDKKTEVKISPDLVNGSLGFYHDYKKNGPVVLEDKYGNVIDRTPDASYSHWPAGQRGILLHLSMERNDNPQNGADSSSWHTAIDLRNGGTAYWNDGGFNFGTPGKKNLGENNNLTSSDFEKMDKDALNGTIKDGKPDSGNSTNPFGNVDNPPNNPAGVGGTGVVGGTGDIQDGTVPAADAPATDTSGDENATDVKIDPSADVKPADTDTPKDNSGENSSQPATTE